MEVKGKTVVQLVSELENEPAVYLDAKEKAARTDAVNFARNNVALEGVELDDVMERISSLYINGIIDDAQHTKLGLDYIDELS